jgi:histidinol-phosphate aminotransferase
VLAVPPTHHGAYDYVELERLGLDPEELVDFSVNSNPYGPPPAVSAALADVPLDRYPDRECLALRRALAEQLSVAAERIVVGNGTAELLWLIANAFVRRDDRVLIVGPTFGEYGRMASLAGADLQRWRARVEDGFAVHADPVAKMIARLHPRIFFLCNPNNPTGAVVPGEVIAHWAGSSPDMLLVVDEAYLHFAPGLSSAIELNATNVLVLRSMTKDYALAGLRLGYAVGPEAIIGAIARVRPPWNVNAMAQAAGVAALTDHGYLQRTMGQLLCARDELLSALRAAGARPVPSAVHFFLLDVGDAGACRRALLPYRILVRNCSSFGLPAHIRIATRTPDENALLLGALSEVAPW